MIRKLLKVAVFLLIANAVYQVAPATIHYLKFKDAVGELALFSQKATDAELVDRVMALAEENSIPLEREYVEVQRQGPSLLIKAAYVETFQFLPGSKYTSEFNVDAKAIR
jgi:hypothetical protein